MAGRKALEENQSPVYQLTLTCCFGDLLANACMLPVAVVCSIYQATIAAYKPVINIHT